MNIQIIPCGTGVKLSGTTIFGTITGVTIRYAAIAYEVSYFTDAQERKEIWVNESEITPNGDVNKQQIGFKP